MLIATIDGCNGDVDDAFTVTAEAWPVSRPSATNESAAIGPLSSSSLSSSQMQTLIAMMLAAGLLKLQLLWWSPLWKNAVVVAVLLLEMIVVVTAATMPAKCWRCHLSCFASGRSSFA